MEAFHLEPNVSRLKKTGSKVQFWRHHTHTNANSAYTSTLLHWPFTDVDLVRVYGARAMQGVRSKNLAVTDSRNQNHTLIFTLSPDLPINLTMARIVKANPEHPGERLLWRGDVFALNSRWDNADSILKEVHHPAVTQKDIEHLSSKAIRRWYDSYEWRHLVRLEWENRL
ncbi:hypothetical protein R3P38DRAFT_327870 [Favolaschia claudopus]|uniref:Uncharacterized protein n=1 Tax=Favolaschia claudopus TaxID=2862362 RepID=A0AAV9ZNB5_9AGAR